MSLGRSLIAIVVLVVLAIGTTGWLLTSHAQPDNRVAVAFPEGVAAVVPLGFSVGAAARVTVNTANPLGSDPTSVEEGHKLFLSLNCAGCHGYDAKGNMGPDLTDPDWRYGGTPIEVYKSIYEGRPQGMPAWGSTLPADSVWQLVAYIQSLGGTFPAPPPGVAKAPGTAEQAAEGAQGGAGQGEGQGAAAGKKP